MHALFLFNNDNNNTNKGYFICTVPIFHTRLEPEECFTVTIICNDNTQIHTCSLTDRRGIVMAVKLGKISPRLENTGENFEVCRMPQ